jgi:hypothetical protein
MTGAVLVSNAGSSSVPGLEWLDGFWLPVLAEDRPSHEPADRQPISEIQRGGMRSWVCYG